MKQLQQKQQEQQKFRELFNSSLKSFGHNSIEERVERCKYLQYEEHKQLFAVSYTNIHASAAENSLAGVKHFLNLHAKRDKKKSTILGVLEEMNKVGMCPLHYAAQKGAVDVAQFLLEQGCNINIRSHEGNTPLMYACKQNQVKMIKFLLEQKADLNAVNLSGFNCLHFAAQSDHFDSIVAVIETVGNQVSDDVSEGKDEDVASIISSARQENNLLQAIRQPSNNKSTPLHLACISSSDRSIELLLKAGANPNAQDSSGETPLHKAARTGLFHLYRMLMLYGALDNIQSIFRETPADSLVDSTHY